MPTHQPSIAIKRAYEPVDEHDGTRVLVDRLWPRGVSKDKARIDLWLKDVAPSNDLRTWYGHDPARFDEFRRRYEAELKTEPARSALSQLRAGRCRTRHARLCRPRRRTQRCYRPAQPPPSR